MPCNCYLITGTQRENVLEIPEDALRETVINAVCHRNYFEKGSRVMIEIFDDRVDITSPGAVAKGITKENFGTVSITRNSVIASMLHRIRYIEQMGTGINRIKEAVKTAKLSEPQFEMSDFFKVTFKRNKSISDGINDGINSTKEMILKEIKKNPRITVAQLSDVAGITKRNIEKNIKVLKDENRLERFGANKNGYWKVIE